MLVKDRKIGNCSSFFFGGGGGCSELHSLNFSLYSFLFVEALKSCGKFWLAFVKKYQEKLYLFADFRVNSQDWLDLEVKQVKD